MEAPRRPGRKRPILLPAAVQFAEVTAADAVTIVRDAKRDTPHLDGLLAR